MAKSIDRWHERVTAANKAYTEWEDRFHCELLEEYWEGFQWEEEDSDQYVINLIYPTVEVRKPSLFFWRPRYRVEPKVVKIDDPLSAIEDRAKLREDALNTFIADKRVCFDHATQLCIHEAHFRFGLVEIGYSASVTDNPRAGKPITRGDLGLTDTGADEVIYDGQEPMIHPDTILEDEMVYVKRIPARQFRVSFTSSNRLEKCDWCGYYEWHRLEDVKANKEYSNTSNLKAGGTLSRQYYADTKDPEKEKHRDMVKLWKIWDLRDKKKKVFVEGYDKFLLDDPFKMLPFAALKFHERLDDFYPLPPVFNWIPPQDELNETREMQRVHRKRAYRRYTYVDGAIDEDELEKLETGGDMTYAKANREEPLSPVPDAPLDAAFWRNLPATKDDFREISGIPGEARGVAEADTATQANILDARARIRDNMGRVQVGEWLSEIGYILMRTIEDNMSLPFWIKVNVDPYSQGAMQEIMQVAQLWQQISVEELGELDYEVSVDVESLSPISEEAERNSWNQVLAILSNPNILFALTQSEVLLRKTLNLYGIRSEKEIREIKRVGLVIMQYLQQQQAAAQGPGNPSPGPTPSNEDIGKQLASQLGVVQ